MQSVALHVSDIEICGVVVSVRFSILNVIFLFLALKTRTPQLSLHIVTMMYLAQKLYSLQSEFVFGFSKLVEVRNSNYFWIFEDTN